MWRELAGAFPGTETADPAAPEMLDRIKERLGQRVPDALRELLLETDGIGDAHGAESVWSAARILEENASFRADEGFRALYMPFDALMFFGDNGGGDQFAFVRTPERDDIFVWDHETDSRTWVAPSLDRYLRSALESDGEDWYRND